MKKTTIIALGGAMLALGACAQTQGPWRTLRKPVAAAAPVGPSTMASIPVVLVASVWQAQRFEIFCASGS